MENGLSCCIITAVQFSLLYILHFEVPIPEGQASVVGNFQSAKNFRFSYKQHMVSYHPHPHFMSLCLFVYFSLCVSVCPSVLPPVRQVSHPYNQPPAYPLPHQPSHPLQPNNFESIRLSLFNIQSVIDKYIYWHSYPWKASVAVDHICNLVLSADNAYSSHQGNHAHSVLVRSRRIHAIAIFRIDFLTVARELNLSALGTSWSSNHRTQGNFFS